MSGATMHIAITGFNGRMARIITSHLLQHANIRIHGLCRDVSKVPEATSNHPRVTVFPLDAFDASSVRAGIKGCETAICCYGPLGSIMLDAQKVLIDACIEEGVARYIASDFTWDFRGIAEGLVPMKNFTIEIAAYGKERKDKIKMVHLLTGAMYENTMTLPGFLWYWDENDKNGSVKSWGTGDEKWEFSAFDDVAKWAVEIVLDRNIEGYVACLGDTLTTKEIAKAFSSVYNKPIELEILGSLDDKIQKARAEKAKDPENPWAGLFDELSWHVLIGTGSMTTPLDNDRFPLVKAKTFQEWLGTKKIEEVSQTYYTL